MLVDIHTNLFWYPDHLSEEFVETSWAAKRAKMRLTGDVHCAVDDTSWKHNFDCRPEQLLEATKGCDKVIVFAIAAPFTGITGSQEEVARFVREHPDDSARPPWRRAGPARRASPVSPPSGTGSARPWQGTTRRACTPCV